MLGISNVLPLRLLLGVYIVDEAVHRPSVSHLILVQIGRSVKPELVVHAPTANRGTTTTLSHIPFAA